MTRLLAAARFPLASLVIAGLLHAQGDPIPFPVEKTTDLREPGQIYTVEGRQTIGHRVTIDGLRHCTIRGVGADATLVLEGKLQLKAVTGGKIRFENVQLEIAPECKELTLSDAVFVGGGMRMTPETTSRVKLFAIKTEFTGGATCDLVSSEGKLEFQSCSFDSRVTIVGAPRSEKSGSNVVVQLEACSGTENGRWRGLLGGLKITGTKSVLVRNCDLGASETAFVDVPRLDFDGNNARSAMTSFSQSEYGAFGKTHIRNCDFRTKLVFSAPPHERDADKAERLMLDHCYFDGRTDPEQIAKAMIVDHSTDPEVSVLCTFAKISAVPLGLGGTGGR